MLGPFQSCISPSLLEHTTKRSRAVRIDLSQSDRYSPSLLFEALLYSAPSKSRSYLCPTDRHGVIQRSLLVPSAVWGGKVSSLEPSGSLLPSLESSKSFQPKRGASCRRE